MPVRFLTEDRRQQFGRFCEGPSEAQLDRFCHLDDADRARLGNRQANHNRLGFAIQQYRPPSLSTLID